MSKQSPGRIGRPAKVDREMMIEAAIAVGFDQLTMPSVGRQLGISHATLYSHIRDRDELVWAAIDRVFDEEDWPDPADPADWRGFLTTVALQLWGLLGRHRGLAYAMDEARQRGMPSGYADFLRRVRGALVDAGFNPLDALTVAGIVVNETTAFYKSGRDANGNSLSFLESNHLPTQRSSEELRGVDDRTRTALAELLAMSDEERFMRRLSIILDGSAALHAKTQASANV